MQILKEASECYIQQCENCGVVLKYSECDINVAMKEFKYTDPINTDITSVFYLYDTFVCPSCFSINEAKRKWLIAQNASLMR